MREEPNEQSTPSSLADGWQVLSDSTVSARATPEPNNAVAPADDATEPSSSLSNAAVMVLGMFGGLTLLYTWGWFVVADAYAIINAATASGSGSVGGVLQFIIHWVAPLAPGAWFIVAFLRTRGLPTSRLLIALVVGAVVTLPYPMLLGAGA